MTLVELSKRDIVLPDDENAISETLIFLLNNICFDMSRERGQHIPSPCWEMPIAPVAEDEFRGGRKNKRPDFTCKCANPRAQSDEEHEIPFHVESKKLGTSTTSSCNFNKNYVVHGIDRFDNETHRYGQRAPSGIMIGYIVSQSPTEILTEVNLYLQEFLSHFPDIVFTNETSALFQTHQHLLRRHVQPFPFELIHLWVDLRGKERR